MNRLNQVLSNWERFESSTAHLGLFFFPPMGEGFSPELVIMAGD